MHHLVILRRIAIIVYYIIYCVIKTNAKPLFSFVPLGYIFLCYNFLRTFATCSIQITSLRLLASRQTLASENDINFVEGIACLPIIMWIGDFARPVYSHPTAIGISQRTSMNRLPYRSRIKPPTRQPIGENRFKTLAET